MVAPKTCSCNERPYFPAKVKAKVGDFERIVSFMPGFVCPVSGPKSHGIHGVDMIWVLKGDKGAVDFVLFTGWMPQTAGRLASMVGLPPVPASIGWHSNTPLFPAHGKRKGKCPWVDGPCYPDTSFTLSEKAFAILTAEGEEPLWAFLESCYRNQFDKSPRP